jgi:hypothetical protein
LWWRRFKTIKKKYDPKHKKKKRGMIAVRHMPCDANKSLTLKLQCARVLSANQVESVMYHLPRDAEQLYALAPGLSPADEEKVLGITRAHERNQARFLECVSHLRAFARGGAYGVHMLNTLHDRILAHFGMQDEKWEALTAAGVRVDFETGALYN